MILILYKPIDLQSCVVFFFFNLRRKKYFFVLIQMYRGHLIIFTE